MIKNFEYTIPLTIEESFALLIESGNEIPQWVLIQSDEKGKTVEWKQSFWSILGFSKIKAYLREPRPGNTLVTVYINRPFQFIDPAKICERVFRKLESKLNEKLGKLLL